MKSITLKIYERILAEAKKKSSDAKTEKSKKSKVPVEAPDDAILGNYAFANVRPGVPPEVNTKAEDKLEKELTTHFVNNIHMSAKSGQALKTSLENDWYEKILSEPKRATVYRGLRVSEEWMVENIGDDWRKQFDETSFKIGAGHDTQGRLKTNNMVLRPITGNASSAVTSWTNNFNLAAYFAFKANPDMEGGGVILCAAIKDNPNQFIDAAKGLYSIDGNDEFAHEEEVLGIGSIKISHIIWL